MIFCSVFNCKVELIIEMIVRIQGISDSFIFPTSNSQAYKQLDSSMEIFTLKSLFQKVYRTYLLPNSI